MKDMKEFFNDIRQFNIIHCIIITTIGVLLGVFGLAFQSGSMYLIYFVFLGYILILKNHKYFYLELLLVIMLLLNFTWTYLYVGKVINLLMPIMWSYTSMFIALLISVLYLFGNIYYRIHNNVKTEKN